MKFSARIIPPAGSGVAEVWLDASDETSAIQQLQADGSLVLSVLVARTGTTSLRKASGRFDVAWWCRELRTLLRSGMTVVEAIDTMLLVAQGDNARLVIQQDLLRWLQQGQSLSRAMQSCAAFPAVLVASVTAAERSSKLVEALDDYLRYDELLERLRRQVVSAAIYPALVVGLGAVITLFLLVFVIPRFSRVYADVPQNVSTATAVILWLSHAVKTHLSWVLGGLASVVMGGVWLWRAGWLRRGFLRLASSIPVLRREWAHFGLARLYHALALMFRGGYPLDEALAVCEDLQLGAGLSGGVARSRAEIAQGRAVAAAFVAGGLADPITERLLSVGERSGGFETVLQTVADRHAMRFTTFVERATRIAEPLLLLMVALVVGGIVVMMYMPIFDMAGTVGAPR